MLDFFNALAEHSFLRNAVLTAVLASIASGVVGTYVVTRRITYIAGGIAHCVLGGMGAAQYCRKVYGWSWAEPILGALVAAVIAAWIIGLVSLRAKEREDTVIGALWAIGMAIGILFLSQTPGYNTELMSYLFGNFLMVRDFDLGVLAVLDLVVVLAGLIFYNQFLAVCFDNEFARLRGVPVEFYYLGLLGLTALTVVLLISVVGIVMVIALLTLPVAVAGHFSRSLWQMMLMASALSMTLTTSGLALSYGSNLPAGATTIVLAGAVYLFVLGGRRLLRSRAKTVGRDAAVATRG